jgi:hypothetical protein
MVVSTAFVVTSLAFLVGPMIAVRAMQDPSAAAEHAGTAGLAEWFNVNGPSLLGVELATMLILSVLAMASDGWFEARRGAAGGRSKGIETETRLP